MKKPSELLGDIVHTLEVLKGKIDNGQFTTPQILEALSSFADTGLDELIRDINDAKDEAEGLEGDLENANDRIEELENE